jgi:DNA modification methylase
LAVDSRDLSGAGWSVLFGSCLDRLPELADNSVDAVVCDPPYELGFMGKSWDSSGIAFNSAVWAECLRVLKPGGHILAFGGSRTWHRIAVAVEDAGFEIRDSIAWLYGSGFPKSLDVSKAIDKASGYQGAVIGTELVDVGMQGGHMHTGRERSVVERSVVERSVEAQKWQGWGTALKPAFEPVIVGRKPLVGTVAANVLVWGTGGLNIDGTRIGTESTQINVYESRRFFVDTQVGNQYESKIVQGRWPSNVMLDEVTAGLVDEQSGVLKSGANPVRRGSDGTRGVYAEFAGQSDVSPARGADSGGASRFFYVAKSSKRDRNEGLDGLGAQEIGGKGNGLARTCVTCRASVLDGCDCPDRTFANPARQNFHPTVKPTDLMRQLVRLVTPPGGVVLDPFTGSGSTGKAAILEGFQFIGCELTKDYLPIIQGRIDWAVAEVARLADVEEEKLF